MVRNMWNLFGLEKGSLDLKQRFYKSSVVLLVDWKMVLGASSGFKIGGDSLAWSSVAS